MRRERRSFGASFKEAGAPRGSGSRGAARATFWAAGLLSLFMTGWLAVSCGSDTGAAGPPCETVFAGQCGGKCVNDNGCIQGLYCGPSGTCTADCAAGGKQCPAGFACSPDGRCVESGGAGGSDPFGDGGLTTSSGTGTGQDACADITVQIEKQIPTVVLLIDQSGSMVEPFPGGDRWNVLRNALMDPNGGVVKQLENEVRFGLTLYTAQDAEPVCPLLENVPIALANYNAINNLYSSASPVEDTPTGESIDAVTKTLEAFAEPGQKVIVLATDGEPDSCLHKDPPAGSPEAQAARDASVKAAQAAFAKDILTFVIAVGNDVAQAHLQDVANAGAGKPIGGGDNAKFYVPTDQQALTDAFKEIINGVRTCVFTLNGKVDAALAEQGAVLLDGQKLGFNDPNGWKLNNESEIEIVGAACDTIQSGDHSLSVTFPCGVVVIDPN